jgi:gluconokinase
MNHLVVMGVSGSGKSTVAEQTAQRLGWEYVDADAYHPPENVAKMRRGEPLDDDDRAGWLAALAALLAERSSSGTPVVLACSALKQIYRDRLAAGAPYRLVYLKGSRELLASRLAGRENHFMNPGLLDSQLATLEEPVDALVLDVARSPDALADEAAVWARA